MNPVFELLPPALREQAVIAGGYAVDPAKASDIDLWVLAGLDADATKNDLRVTYPDHLAPDNTEYPGRLVLIFPKAYEGRDVQVLVSEFDELSSMLANFDLSVHARALLPNGQTRCGPLWAPPTEGGTIWVTRWTTPAQTLQRLRKLERRYGMVGNPRDVLMLEKLAKET